MECRYKLGNGCMTIVMPKEVDHHCAEQIKKEADLLISAYRVKRLVFDFYETEFMDSSGIGVIIGRCKNMGFAGGEVEAAHLSPRIQKIFVVSGLHKLVRLRDSDTNGQNEKTEEEE